MLFVLNKTYMVKVRLTLKGRKGQPYYHIVALDSRKRNQGKVLETLGFYDPHKEKSQDKAYIDKEKYQAWLTKGAQPSETVVQILKFGSK